MVEDCTELSKALVCPLPISAVYPPISLRGLDLHPLQYRLPHDWQRLLQHLRIKQQTMARDVALEVVTLVLGVVFFEGVLRSLFLHAD